LSGVRSSAASALDYQRVAARTLAEVEGVAESATARGADLTAQVAALEARAESLDVQAAAALELAAEQIDAVRDAREAALAVAGRQAELALRLHGEAVAAESAWSQAIIDSINALDLSVVVNVVVPDAGGGEGYAEGGIARGPASGYPATLHGTEAIIPLSGGRAVPVVVTGDTAAAEIAALRAELLALGTQQLRYQRRMDAIFRRWEVIGQPAERVSG
jgi:hypothetical protein